jgi:hypothetical protein
LKDLPNDNESDIEGVNMLSDLPISEQRISEIQQYTLNDEQMQELIKPCCTVSSSRTSKYIIADGGTSYFLFGQPF